MGSSLKHMIANTSLNIADCIDLSIMIAKSLQKIHSSNIIHKRLNPNKIYVHPLEKKTQIIGLKKSVQLSQEYPVIINPEDIKEQIPYMAPEQTGIMNRLIDYRSDYYSLGVILYELFTRQLPFQSENHYQIIISHLSMPPAPLFMHNTDIPQILSEIVLKLMAKFAEDRYQSTKGLLTDLQECLRQLDQYGTIEPFPLQRNDFPEQLNISEQLYGRESEILTMKSALERVRSGSTEILLITGPPCIGKTSLVRELQFAAIPNQGLLVSGKYDQFQKDVPYSGLITALRDLIRQLSSNLIGVDWKNDFQHLLGKNIDILIEQIPELRPLKTEESGLKNETNLQEILLTTIKFFCKINFPLIIFLDDLQWVDSASLNLIEKIMSNNTINNLLFIGVYRQIEMNELHPLMLTVRNLSNTSIRINTVVLEELEFAHVYQFLCDTLNDANKDDLHELAECLYEKTKGNPFQMKEYLKYAKENSLFFNNKGMWKWSINEIINSLNFTDEIDLMSNRIKGLSQEEQSILQKAACLGGPFEQALLKAICRDIPVQFSITIQKLISEQFLVPVTDEREIQVFMQDDKSILSREIKFKHDCIQQAAYALLSEKEKHDLHLEVGFLLKEKITTIDNRPPILFCIINNLNMASHLISSKKEKAHLSFLNYQAGVRAKKVSAYATALKYLKQSIDLLDKNCWYHHKAQTLKQFIITAETACLCGEFDFMQTMAETAFQHATSLSDRFDIREIQIQAYISQSKISLAIQTALDILQQVGLTIPEKPTYIQLTGELLKAVHAMAGKKSSDLTLIPHMKDPIKQKAMKILFRLYGPAYQSNPKLLYFIVLKHIYLSLRHGNTRESAFAYAAYGTILIRLFKKNSLGYDLGNIAVSVHSQFEKEDDPEGNRAVLLLFINLFINHWEKNLQSTLPEFLTISQKSYETGEIEYAANALALHSAYSFFIGRKLTTINHEMKAFTHVIKKYRQEYVYRYQVALKKFIEELLECNDRKNLHDVNIDQTELENVSYLLFIENFSKHFMCLIFNKYLDSYTYMTHAKKYQESVVGTMTYIFFHCTASLAMINLYPDVNQEQQKYILYKVSLYKRKLKKWAFMAEKNYLEKYYIIEAEFARIQGRHKKAMKYYDLAIKAAIKNNFIHFHAIINELAASFYLSINKTSEASNYLDKSIKSYLEWEAFAKVNQLKENPKYAALIREKGSVVDYQDIVEVSPFIFDDTNINQLCPKLMEIYQNFSSARTVILLFTNNNNCILSQKIGATTTVNQGPLDELLKHCNPIQKKCISHVLMHHTHVVSNTPSEMISFASGNRQTNSLPKSALCIPLVVKSKYSGCVYIEHNEIKGLFTQGIIHKIEQFTLVASLSMNNANRFQKMKAKAIKTEYIIKKRSQQLFQSGRLNKIGELASGVAHELSQPLSIINIQAGILKDYFHYDAPEDTEVEKVVEIVNQVEYASELIDRMRIFSRLKHDTLELTKTDEQLLNILHFFYEEFRIQGITLKVDISENLPPAQMNGQKFDQMMVHLLMNAQYAVNQKARQTKDTFEKIITLRLYYNDQLLSLVFEISDNGTGMSEDVRKNCQKPFFSTKEPGEAMGLGLYYVTIIAKEYHLKISQKNNETGSGCTFTLLFPLEYKTPKTHTDTTNDESVAQPHPVKNNQDSFFVLQSIRLIHSNIELKQTLETILKFCIEITGAERSFYTLYKNEQLLLAAEITQENRQSKPVFDYYPESPQFKESSEIYRSLIQAILAHKDKNSTHIKTTCEKILKQSNSSQSIFCHPVRTTEGLIGMLFIESKQPSNDNYGEQISKISKHIDISLQNATSFEDISKKNHHVNHILHDRNEQLLHAGRLSAIGELSKGIVNEINQALTIIRLSADELLDYFEEKDQVSMEVGALKDIAPETERAANIINELSQYSIPRINQTTNLGESIQNSLSYFKYQFKSNNIKVTFDFQDNLPDIPIDSNKFEQIMINIVSNAIYSLNKKSELLETTFQKEIILKIFKDQHADNMILKITDNGLGMDAETLQKCMSAFYTTKEKEDGTGLGLYIVRRLLTEFNMNIEVDSIEGQECTFTIDIPVK